MQARANNGETRKGTREPVQVSWGATKSIGGALVHEDGVSGMEASLGLLGNR